MSVQLDLEADDCDKEESDPAEHGADDEPSLVSRFTTRLPSRASLPASPCNNRRSGRVVSAFGSLPASFRVTSWRRVAVGGIGAPRS